MNRYFIKDTRMVNMFMEKMHNMIKYKLKLYSEILLYMY